MYAQVLIVEGNSKSDDFLIDSAKIDLSYIENLEGEGDLKLNALLFLGLYDLI